MGNITEALKRIEAAKKSRVLDLSNLQLTDSDLRKVFKPEILQNNFVFKIDLSNNKLTYLPLAIKTFTNSLLEVRFDNNQLGDDGVENLIPILKECTNLGTINFDGNPLGEELSKSINNVFNLLNKTELSVPANSIFHGVPGMGMVEPRIYFKKEIDKAIKDLEKLISTKKQKSYQIITDVIQGSENTKLSKEVVELRKKLAQQDKKLIEQGNELRDLKIAFLKTQNTEQSKQELEKLIEQRYDAFVTRIDQLAAKTVSQEEWKEIVQGLNQLLKEYPEDQEILKEIHAKIEDLLEIEGTNAKILANIKLKYDKEEKLNEVNDVLYTPEARMYYDTLVSEINSIYMVASMAKTKYVEVQNKGKVKKLTQVLRGVGRLVPGVSGYFDTAATVVDRIGLHYTEKHLAAFDKIANSPVEMNYIITKVARKLAMNNQNLDEGLAKTHAHKMIKEVFDGKLKDITNPEDVINALYKATEKKLVKNQKTQRQAQAQGRGIRGYLARGTEQNKRYAGDLVPNSNEKDLKQKIEHFITASRDIIFDPNLSHRDNAKIQLSLSQTLYDCALIDQDFCKDLLDRDNLDVVWNVLKKGISELSISKMEKIEIDIETSKLSERLAQKLKAVAPEQNKGKGQLTDQVKRGLSSSSAPGVTPAAPTSQATSQATRLSLGSRRSGS